jgi:hypothetical protein
MTVEAIAAWLDAGKLDHVRAADRIRQIIAGVIVVIQSQEPPIQP